MVIDESGKVFFAQPKPTQVYKCSWKLLGNRLALELYVCVYSEDFFNSLLVVMAQLCVFTC